MNALLGFNHGSSYHSVEPSFIGGELEGPKITKYKKWGFDLYFFKGGCSRMIS